MLLGLTFCAVGGVVPVFLPLFPVIFVTRCFFGTGCGLLMSSLLTLIVHFFDGQTRSTMIGLNDGISGIGSALATFAAGLLLAFGWNVSFAVYFLGFAVLALVLVFVPKVKNAAPAESAKKKTANSRWAYGETATNLVLVFQSVGAFVTPWLGNLFGLVSADLKVQFFMTAACFILLTAVSVWLTVKSAVQNHASKIEIA